MGYDLKRSHFSVVLEKSVSTGAVITEEGVVLVSVLDAATGVEKVQASGGISGEIVAGFALRDNADHATTASVENLTIPTTPAALTLQLANNNIVAATPGTGNTSNLRCVASTTGFLSLGNAGVAASGTVGVNDATGLLTFHSDEEGQTVVVTYTYNLTVAEARLLFYQRNINNEASTLFSQVGVGHGHGEVFTDQFNATLDWSAGTAITSGVAGVLTQAGNGAVLDARVVSVPNVNNPMLGIAFNIGGTE
jgi:hypothetical protein